MRRAHSGLRFQKFTGKDLSPFEEMLKLFKELLLHTAGDVDEAVDWLRELDKEYSLSKPDYTVDDFIEDLFKKRFLQEAVPSSDPNSKRIMTAKMEQYIRKSALEQIFGQLKKSGGGNHKTKYSGSGEEISDGLKSYSFGDPLDSVSMTDSLRNAQINSGFGDLQITERDLLVHEKFQSANMATVLMIDLSHSMILYGEDRITPAKRVALALAELVKTRYPKDTLDIIAFGNDAWPISLEELPYLQVGPYHTNTVAGLDLAAEILRKKRTPNRQIFMITDGKPSCLKEADGSYYKNSVGLDDYIVGKCINRAAALKKANIPVITFMIASDHWLQDFVEKFTQANKGKAFYTGLKGLGEWVLKDYEKNRKNKL